MEIEGYRGVEYRRRDKPKDDALINRAEIKTAL